MKYKIIFTLGFEDDDENASLRGSRGDLLVQDENENFFNFSIETIEMVNDYILRDDCLFSNKILIVKDISKKTIIYSIHSLIKQQFYKLWQPITQKYLEDHYYPKEKWEIFAVEVDDFDEM